MLRNNLKVAWRNLWRQKGSSFINMLGLSLGIACCILAFLYLKHEHSFEDYHANLNRLYRLVAYGGFGEKSWQSYVGGDPIEEMRTSYTDVEDALTIRPCAANNIQWEGEVFRDIDMMCSASNVFNLFSFSMVRGDTAAVLDRPFTAVITRSLANLLFGEADPIGQALPIYFYGEEQLFEITGLMEDVPLNTHFTFDLLLSYESLKETNLCLHCGQPMYALLTPGANPEAIADRLLTLIRDTQGREYIEDIRLEPLSEVHFSDIQAPRQGDIRYVYLLSAVAVIILLMACSNYMNLAVARAMGRTRDVGVRKVVGARRHQIAFQYILETLLLVVLTIPLALGILLLTLPWFNQVAETGIMIEPSEVVVFLSFVVGIVVLVGFVSGSYPAIVLSRPHPIEVLRGRLRIGFSGVLMRRTLVVFQFCASIVLLVLTTITISQLDFIQTKKLGFDAEQIVMVSITDPEISRRPGALKQAFLQIPGVQYATAGQGLPGEPRFSGHRFTAKPFGEEGAAIDFVNPAIDFLQTMGIQLLAGSNITDLPDEFGKWEVLLNEASVAAMGWSSPEEAVGQDINGFIVKGVVPDFHFQSMHQSIRPLMLAKNRRGSASRISLRLRGGEVQNSLKGLEKAWKDTGTLMPFEYSFLTEEMNDQYESEQRTARVFGVFSAVAILIACLGLLGLAAFSAARRTKEIGIRKVLGATVAGVMVLITKDYLKLILIAFVIATPLAYLSGKRWLEDFAYQVELSWLMFAIAGFSVIVVAILSVSFQAFRAATNDPVESLRYE